VVAYVIVEKMRVLGIDPGIAITGFGIIETVGHRSKAEDYGCILTSKDDIVAERLTQLYRHLMELFSTRKPDVVVVEKLFFNTNVTTGIVVSQARGIVLLAAHQHALPIFEYTPIQVKAAICGYGGAKKPQVQQMVQVLLHLTEIPKPDDAADALAIALCHTNLGTVTPQTSQVKVAA
jgi:crossover junction endodeoxyribonuclease RuvC